MENKEKNHDLVEFAEQQLKEHIAELNTHYQGREIDSKEKQEAIATHLNMLRAELKEKSKELSGNENNDVISEYEQKFKQALP